jgi:hypothetical protein
MGELVKPVSKSQGGLPRIPKGQAYGRGCESLFSYYDKVSPKNRYIRGRLASTEESKGTMVIPTQKRFGK